MGRGGPRPAHQVGPGDLQLEVAVADLEEPEQTAVIKVNSQEHALIPVSQLMSNDHLPSDETSSEDADVDLIVSKDVDHEETVNEHSEVCKGLGSRKAYDISNNAKKSFSISRCKLKQTNYGADDDDDVYRVDILAKDNIYFDIGSQVSGTEESSLQASASVLGETEHPRVADLGSVPASGPGCWSGGDDGDSHVTSFLQERMATLEHKTHANKKKLSRSSHLSVTDLSNKQPPGPPRAGTYMVSEKLNLSASQPCKSTASTFVKSEEAGEGDINQQTAPGRLRLEDVADEAIHHDQKYKDGREIVGEKMSPAGKAEVNGNKERTSKDADTNITFKSQKRISAEPVLESGDKNSKKPHILPVRLTDARYHPPSNIISIIVKLINVKLDKNKLNVMKLHRLSSS